MEPNGQPTARDGDRSSHGRSVDLRVTQRAIVAGYCHRTRWHSCGSSAPFRPISTAITSIVSRTRVRTTGAITELSSGTIRGGSVGPVIDTNAEISPCHTWKTDRCRSYNLNINTRYLFVFVYFVKPSTAVVRRRSATDTWTDRGYGSPEPSA